MTTILAFLLSSFMVLLSNVARESVKLSEGKCEELPEPGCPACSSRHLIKNGSVHNGKPKHQCKSCGRQFVVNPTKTTVSQEIKQLIERLLLERISLLWNCQSNPDKLVLIKDYVKQKLARTPCQSKVSGKSLGRLIIECDQMWSFVNSQKNSVCIWLALEYSHAMRNERK